MVVFDVTVTKLIKHRRTFEIRNKNKISACTKLEHKGVDAGFFRVHFLLETPVSRRKWQRMKGSDDQNFMHGRGAKEKDAGYGTRKNV